MSSLVHSESSISFVSSKNHLESASAMSNSSSIESFDLEEVTNIETIKKLTVQSLEMTADTVQFLRSFRSNEETKEAMRMDEKMISRMRDYSIACLSTSSLNNEN